MAEAANRIHAKGPYRHEEAYAAEAGIYPGMLIQLDSDGKVELHDSQGQALGDETLIAEEDALQGNTVDTVYTISTICSYLIPQKGSVVRALIKAGEDIAIGDELVSNGDGLFIEDTSVGSGVTVTRIYGVAEEACDLTASGASNTLCMMRVV